MYRNGDVSSCAKLEVSEVLQGEVSEHRRVSRWTNSTWKDDPSENEGPEFHIIICLMEPWLETKQQMSQNSLGGCQDCKITAGTTVWDRVCGGKGERGEMGLKKVWIPRGIRGCPLGGGEKVGAFPRGQMIEFHWSHTERNFLLLIH